MERERHGYFYGPNLKILAEFSFTATPGVCWYSYLRLDAVYFGSMLVATTQGVATTEYLSIVNRLGTGHPGYAYGTDIGTKTGSGLIDFATYLNDSMTGFEYANQRWYSAGMARFLTIDSYTGSAQSADPVSWNRYGYSGGDPINRYDPLGLDWWDPKTQTLYGDPPPNIGFISFGPFQGVNSGIDPYPFSVRRAYVLASAYKNRVKRGSLSDCQALASFAQELADSGLSPKNFVQDFGVLTPKDLSNVVPGIAWNSNPVTLSQPGDESGYQFQYQNTLPDNAQTGWNGDQGHHFAAFFQFGYVSGSATAGSVAAFGLEYFQGLSSGIMNLGDVALGEAAASLGAGLKSGTWAPEDIANLIASTICNH